jgi:hypothetical protein
MPISTQVRFDGNRFNVSDGDYQVQVSQAVLNAAVRLYLDSQFSQLLGKVFIEFPLLSREDVALDGALYNIYLWAHSDLPTIQDLQNHADFLTSHGAEGALTLAWETGHAEAEAFIAQHGAGFTLAVARQPYAPEYAMACGFEAAGLSLGGATVLAAA